MRTWECIGKNESGFLTFVFAYLRYLVKWYRPSNPEDIRVKEIPGDVTTEGIGRKISVLVQELHPGVDYMFEITTEAHE